MAFGYEVVNPPIAGMKAPEGYTYIYVLMFNMPGSQAKPFYVGQARNLTQRFNGHQMITWHVAKLGEPPKIYIAGHVRNNDADLAEQNLIARLSRSGYRLSNTIVTRAGKLARREPSILTAHPAGIRRYLDAAAPQKSVLEAWRAQFNLGGKRPQVVSEIELTSNVVVSYVEGLQYLSPDAKQLSLLIASSFDPGFQASVVDLVTPLKGQMGTKTINREVMRVRDIWVFSKGNLEAGKHRSFKLTKKHTTAAVASRTGLSELL